MTIATTTNPERVISRLRARLIARYRLVAVPGRPEELEQRRSGRRVSVVYGGHGSIRVRKQDGRVWTGRIDQNTGTLDLGRYGEVYDMLDPHFLALPVSPV